VEISGGTADLKLRNEELVLRQQDGCCLASLSLPLQIIVEGMVA
jgi:hypothetical protein